MIQRRAARMVLSDYKSTSSVTSMLNKLQWTTLQERRAQAKAVMMYRVVHQLIDIPSYLLVPIIPPRGNNITFLAPYARTLILQRSFFPDGIRIWNSLLSEACHSTIHRQLQDPDPGHHHQAVTGPASFLLALYIFTLT